MVLIDSNDGGQWRSPECLLHAQTRGPNKPEVNQNKSSIVICQVLLLKFSNKNNRVVKFSC